MKENSTSTGYESHESTSVIIARKEQKFDVLVHYRKQLQCLLLSKDEIDDERRKGIGLEIANIQQEITVISNELTGFYNYLTLDESVLLDKEKLE